MRQYGIGQVFITKKQHHRESYRLYIILENSAAQFVYKVITNNGDSSISKTTNAIWIVDLIEPIENQL
jgi:hypothetical protein